MTKDRPGPVAIRFGDNLRAHRRRVGLSQERLAVIAELNRDEISKLELGLREPRLLTLIKLATALEVPLDDLAEGIEWRLRQLVTEDGELVIDGRGVSDARAG
jgi:transcriptional regulator with XRE-family HTH domain